MAALRTQVGIIGAGPAGLVLAHLLHQRGIESIVLENRSRDYVEKRVRAGVLEQGTAELLDAAGVGARMRKEGLVHDGINLRFAGERHHIDFRELTGRTITVYGQQEVVKDLIAARLANGGAILFEAEATSIEALESDRPQIVYRAGEHEKRVECDFVAGCDGSHGVARLAMPEAGANVYERDYPFSWL